MVIEKNTILYFTGTGNSLMVAKDISNELGDVRLCKIASLAKEESIRVEAGILGIVFPVYYSRLPLIVEQIVKKLEVNKDTYVFGVATHGNAPANVLKRLKNILHNNGTRLNSSFLIGMPSSNVFYLNASPLKKQNRAFALEKKKVKEISQIIRERKDCKCEVTKLVLDRVMDKVSVRMTNKIMEKLHEVDNGFWINEKCNGCKLCEKICPVNNIKFKMNRPTWTHNCEKCACCIQHCPKQAIQFGRGSEKRKRYANPYIKVIELYR